MSYRRSYSIAYWQRDAEMRRAERERRSRRNRVLCEYVGIALAFAGFLALAILG